MDGRHCNSHLPMHVHPSTHSSSSLQQLELLGSVTTFLVAGDVDILGRGGRLGKMGKNPSENSTLIYFGMVFPIDSTKFTKVLEKNRNEDAHLCPDSKGQLLQRVGELHHIQALIEVKAKHQVQEIWGQVHLQTTGPRGPKWAPGPWPYPKLIAITPKR